MGVRRRELVLVRLRNRDAAGADQHAPTHAAAGGGGSYRPNYYGDSSPRRMCFSTLGEPHIRRSSSVDTNFGKSGVPEFDPIEVVLVALFTL